MPYEKYVNGRIASDQREALDFLEVELGLSNSETFRQLLPSRAQAERIVARIRSGQPASLGKALREHIDKLLDRPPMEGIELDDRPALMLARTIVRLHQSGELREPFDNLPVAFLVRAAQGVLRAYGEFEDEIDGKFLVRMSAGA